MELWSAMAIGIAIVEGALGRYDPDARPIQRLL
jgi:hypothetical protein